MQAATEIYGAVIRGSSALVVGRLALADGTILTRSAIGSVRYSVFERDACQSGVELAVAGHTNVSLDPDDVFTTSPLTGAGWDLDEVGYTFRHTLDPSLGPVFAIAGRTYVAEYRVQPVAEAPFVIRFLIEAL